MSLLSTFHHFSFWCRWIPDPYDSSTSDRGSNQCIIHDLLNTTIGGTSASAPIVASGLTLINDLRKKAGKSTLGWINPTVYSCSGAWNDITSGGSYGCGSGNGGFPVGPGWDPSTGMGTPNFAGLRKCYGV